MFLLTKCNRFTQKFDIVVGDITITANRSLYVDFTLPYTESGVTMVVPARNERRNAWVFLMPLKTDLWVASLCAFIFIAFSIWVLEHRINDEFRGPPLHQAGTSLFYSFSMLVFAQSKYPQSALLHPNRRIVNGTKIFFVINVCRRECV